MQTLMHICLYTVTVLLYIHMSLPSHLTIHHIRPDLLSCTHCAWDTHTFLCHLALTHAQINLMPLQVLLNRLATPSSTSSRHWAIPFNKGTSPMDDRAGQNLVLRSPGQTVVYGELRMKFTREYGDILVCQYPLGHADTEIWGYA